MRRHLELEGRVRLESWRKPDYHVQNLDIPVTREEVPLLALELVLIAAGHASRLRLTSPGQEARIERGEKSTLATTDGVHAVEFSRGDLGALIAFLLDEHRDGPMERDHLHIGVESAAADDVEVTVTVRGAEPPERPGTLRRLQRWYVRQCDGEWEHSHGVTIDTLDNPGWRAKIDLVGTPLADASFDRHELHRSDDDWVVCWVEEDAFHAACGPRNLEEALEVFLDWADG